MYLTFTIIYTLLYIYIYIQILSFNHLPIGFSSRGYPLIYQSTGEGMESEQMDFCCQFQHVSALHGLAHVAAMGAVAMCSRNGRPFDPF